MGAFDPLALLCTSRAYHAAQIVEWFVQRWQLEVTLEEVRTHLGMETQRQWSDPAIARTTPALLGPFSWVTLAAHLLQQTRTLAPRQTAWYQKPLPTFSDALAWVRLEVWSARFDFSTSSQNDDVRFLSQRLWRTLIEPLCYAA
jgi:hypothetical protein